MFKNLIVGVDGREGGRDAIALAYRLVDQDGELTLAFVYSSDARNWRGSTPAYDAAERESERELLEKARDEAGVKARLGWIGSPSAGRGLHELADAISADLIVVGSSRRGLLGRVLVGDDTRAALNGAPCAVAIAPAGYADHPALMREIGVGYDGSPESECAVKTARALASQSGAKLSAFEVVSIPAYAAAGGVFPALIDSCVEDARNRIAALGGVEPHAAFGQTAEELALYSASLDLLVVGSRGYGPAGRLVHGSTSQQLARVARCPLLVLTRAARQAGASGTTNDRDVAVAGDRVT